MIQTATEWLAEKYNYVTWLRNRDEISAEQSQVATTNEPVERMRFHNDGRVTARDKHGNIIDIINFRNDT